MPNGLLFKFCGPLLLKARTLAHATPRLVSSLQVIAIVKSPVEGLEAMTRVLGSQMRKRFGIKVSAKVVADILAPFLRHAEHPIDRLGTVLDLLGTYEPSVKASESHLHQLLFVATY